VPVGTSVGGPARAVETVWVLPGRHVRGLLKVGTELRRFARSVFKFSF